MNEKHSSSGRGGDSKRSKGKDARGKPRHGENAEHGEYYGEEGYYPPMESSYQQSQQYERQQAYSAGQYQQDHPQQHQQHQQQQAYYSRSAPRASSASSGPKLSAILNHEEPSEDYAHHIGSYPSASTSAPDSRFGSSGSMGNTAASSKMALHNALSPTVPTTPSTTISGLADNSFASVVLSDQRSVTSASDVTYTSHTHSQSHPQAQGYRTHDGHPMAMYASAEDFQKGKANLDYHYYHAHSSNNSDSYSHSHEQDHEQEHDQYTASSHGNETDRRASGSCKSSRHYNAAASYTSEPSSRGPPPSSSRSDAKRTPTSKSASSRSRKEPKSEQSERGSKVQKTPSHYHNSHFYAATPSSSAGISSPAFSAPDTPGQQTPLLVSVGAGSYGSTEGDGEGEGEGGYYEQDQEQGQGQDSDENASSYGVCNQDRNRDQRDTNSAQPQPAVQRERNRVAATKCRAKLKAATTKLEEESRIMSDQRQSLVAQKSALLDEMLNLREQLLLHSSCHSSCEGSALIKKYLSTAARTIADSGGKQLIWGPDGTGQPWGGEDSHHGHHHGHHGHDDHEHRHGHERGHDNDEDTRGKGQAKKEKKRR